MNTKRKPTRRVEENEVKEMIPSQVEEVEQVPQGGQGDQVPIVGGGYEPPEFSNRDIGDSLLALARPVTTRVNLSMMPRANVVESTMTFRLRNFVRINRPIFIGFKVGEDPQEFIDEVYKIVHDMRVTSREKAELSSYQLKDVDQV